MLSLLTLGVLESTCDGTVRFEDALEPVGCTHDEVYYTIESANDTSMSLKSDELECLGDVSSSGVFEFANSSYAVREAAMCSVFAVEKMGALTIVVGEVRAA